MPKPPKPAPVVSVAFLPWGFWAQSRTNGDKRYAVNLSSNDFKGFCECRYNRISGLQCSHLKAVRELFFKEVAPKMVMAP